MKLFKNFAFASAAALIAASLFSVVASADVGNNTNTSNQQGINQSTSTQSGVGISGNVTTIDSATGTSGAATVGSIFQGSQSLTLTQHNQSDLGSGLNVTNSTNTGAQVAGNGLTNGQTNGASSGVVNASGSSTSVSGAVTSNLSNIQAQLQTLLQNNQSTFPAP
jgi:hypothetical protein